jgi:phage-related protein (TIGR01555 family)
MYYKRKMSKKHKNKINKIAQPQQQIDNSKATINNGFSDVVNYFYKPNTLFQPYILSQNARYNLQTTMNWYALETYYMTYSFIKNFIDVPVEDAFWKGIDIHTSELDDEDIIKFKQYLSRNQIDSKIKQAIKWMRLFGGAGILINESSKENWAEEFNINNIKKGDHVNIYPVHRWELFSSNMYDNANIILNYLPETSFYLRGHEIHPSRFYKMRNEQLPFPLDCQVQGWGMSEIEKVMDCVNMFIETKKGLFQLICENKIDVFYRNGMAEQLASAGNQGSEKVIKSMELVNQLKNYQNAIVLDSLDRWERKTIDFAGWPEVIRELRIDLCAALTMPATKLWGVALISNLGQNNEGDMDNYNINLESKIRHPSRALIEYIYQICCMCYFGFIPDDFEIHFPNLKNLSAVEEQQNKRDKANIILNLYDRGKLDDESLEEILAKEDILKLKIRKKTIIPPPQAEYGSYNKLSYQNSKEYSFLK